MRGGFNLGQLPTGRDGRLLALGLLVVALGLVWLLVVAPLSTMYAAREESLDGKIRYAERMAILAAALPRVRAEAAAESHLPPPPNLILAGASDAIAAANLESTIDTLSHDAGTTLISTESLPPAQVGSFRRIALHATARAQWDKLIQLLAAIERASPRLAVSNLQVQAGPLGGAEQLLDMSMTVEAFRAGNATGAELATDSADPGAGP